MGKSVLQRKIKKIIVEFEDSDNLELDFNNNESFIISGTNGSHVIPGKFNEMERVSNGLSVMNILIGPDFVINPLSVSFNNEISMSLNNY
ncbi:hypothetical protein [Flavobacterium sp. WC2509]|uniref:hypothetical protein n=1 Tax=Flavobacterium sp. WC2509 TaxID=3461406 RepID=UPI0040444F37